MPHLEELKWDFKDNFKEASLDLAGNKAYYTYDASGNRVRKVVEKGNIKEERIYLGDYEIFRKFVGSSIDTERETVHISDDNQKIAQIDGETIRYQLSDHLGSASLELDENAEIISYEEYYPFGTTSYRSGRFKTEVSLKRYKYVMKELDNETGLYHYGARYYASWLGRWTASDPLAEQAPNWTPYRYAFNNPLLYIDPNGLFEIVKPTSEEALTMVKNTLTEEDAQYVKLDENGNIDADLLSQAESSSGNLAELKTLVNDERTYEVSVSSEIEYKTETGEVKTKPMGDIYYTDFITGEPIEAEGWRGVCQTPGSEPHKYNSVVDNVRIHVNKNLNERDRARVFSHEAYGHGSFYSQGKDHFHRFVNMKDTNTALKNQINNRVNETEKNYDARGN